MKCLWRNPGSLEESIIAFVFDASRPSRGHVCIRPSYLGSGSNIQTQYNAARRGFALWIYVFSRVYPVMAMSPWCKGYSSCTYSRIKRVDICHPRASVSRELQPPFHFIVSSTSSNSKIKALQSIRNGEFKNEKARARISEKRVAFVAMWE